MKIQKIPSSASFLILVEFTGQGQSVLFGNVSGLNCLLIAPLPGIGYFVKDILRQSNLNLSELS